MHTMHTRLRTIPGTSETSRIGKKRCMHPLMHTDAYSPPGMHTGPTPAPSFVRPTPTPLPTFLTYVVRSGDTLSSIPFASVLQNAVSEYSTLQQTADTESQQLGLGNTDNLAQVTIDSLKAKAALQTTVQLTSRIVTAYKEIMQMQV